MYSGVSSIVFSAYGTSCDVGSSLNDTFPEAALFIQLTDDLEANLTYFEDDPEGDLRNCHNDPLEQSIFKLHNPRTYAG